MIREAALVTISAVLFIQMGLSSAIQENLHFRSRIASCPKCATFWSVLAYLLLTGNALVISVAASFICAYSAQWLALAYDALAVLYNSIYESITETKDAASVTGPGEDDPAAPSAADEVSEM